MDSVTANVNNIRTVLPKSNREAAHSPPRHRTKMPIPSSSLDSIEPTLSSSLPRTPTMAPPGSKLSDENTLSTVDDTNTPVNPEKVPLKMIKQRSFSSKTIYQSGNPMTTTGSSDPTLKNSKSSQRMCNNFIRDLCRNIRLHRFE